MSGLVAISRQKIRMSLLFFQIFYNIYLLNYSYIYFISNRERRACNIKIIKGPIMNGISIVRYYIYVGIVSCNIIVFSFTNVYIVKNTIVKRQLISADQQIFVTSHIILGMDVIFGLCHRGDR